MPASGDHSGEFILRRELGRGAMGVVWEAWQTGLSRSVALKVLNEGVGADPIWVARFKAEAAQAAKLSHPGILPIYAAFVRQTPAAERTALTPEGWRGGEPPTGLPEQDPILGLSRAQAEAYARSQKKRLPLDHELVNASAPARIGEVVREVWLAAKPKGALRLTPRELQTRMKRAFEEAGERIERVEGLRGWDGRPEWAVGGEGPHEGLDAPWPRIEPLDSAGSGPDAAPAVATRPDRSGGPRRPREMLERLPPALRLAR